MRFFGRDFLNTELFVRGNGMRGNIIPYLEMCQNEDTNLQKGLNFRLKRGYSVILMSRRRDASYHDELVEDGTVLIYEGHDVPKTKDIDDPKLVDQPEYRQSGSLTENGKFHKAAQDFKAGVREPELVRVYEKIIPGVWSDNGFFYLVDSWVQSDGTRKVFKFKLRAIEGDTFPEDDVDNVMERSRVIPTSVKLEVWKRDGGKCVICGATDELHFDHIVPYSKGGTSLKAENIQLLCARHNLQKGAKIQ